MTTPISPESSMDKKNVGPWTCDDQSEFSDYTYVRTGEQIVADCTNREYAVRIVRCVNSHASLLEALEFARGEAIVARGVLWSKADAVENLPDGRRHSAQLRRSAEKLDEVIRSADAALALAKGAA